MINRIRLNDTPDIWGKGASLIIKAMCILAARAIGNIPDAFHSHENILAGYKLK
ncbi:hypothetical protein ACFL0D_01920 [Thermoproteota archaeon]